MGVRTTTELSVIGDVLDRVVALDPVRGTLLGTIRLGLTREAWAAWLGDAVAVRSESQWPVALSAGWDAQGLEVLAGLLAAVPDLVGVSGDDATVETLLGLLALPVADRDAQGLYRLDTLTPPTVTGAPLRAGEVHRQLVRHWFAEFTVEAHDMGPRPDAIADNALVSGACWLWVDGDGTPVSLAARRPVVAGSARVGPVYTPPALRGHGYASGITAAVTQTILDEGAVPVLFTDLANPTSNGIYRTLGYRLVENRTVARFGR